MANRRARPNIKFYLLLAVLAAIVIVVMVLIFLSLIHISEPTRP